MNTRKHRVTFATLLGAALLVTGCATPRIDITPVRNAWLGASYEEVVSRWGTPVRSTSFNDGRLIYTWFSEATSPRSSVRPSIGVSAGSGMGVGIGIGVTSGAQRDAYVTCERTLIFKDGRVVDQSWFGLADFCSTFKRN
ncbi:MAG: hypothetical protein ABL891_13545 [Burkholderiales bacterium]